MRRLTWGVTVVAIFGVAISGCGTRIGDAPGGDDPEPGGPDSGTAVADAAPVDERVDYTPSNIGDGPLTAGTDALVITLAASPVTINTDIGRLRDAANNDILPPGVVYAQIEQTGPDIGVFSATDIVIEPGAELVVVGERALALAASENVLLEGTIVATGGRDSPDEAGPGGENGGIANSRTGRGDGGGGGGSTQEAGSDSGGGGGGHGGTGGKGGDRAGGFIGGAGGGENGDATLVGLVGGSGGGAGGGLGPEVIPGRGGGGGGAVQISARGTIRLGSGGGINAGGGGGEGGNGDDAGGGGGAGGAILFEALAIHVNGVVAANGGGGGAGAEANNQRGEAGQTGQLSADAAQPGTGGVEGTSGGPGAAGANLAGGPGQDAQNNDTVNDNAGGGGGGAGRIVFRSRDPGTRDGTSSPAANELALP